MRKLLIFCLLTTAFGWVKKINASDILVTHASQRVEQSLKSLLDEIYNKSLSTRSYPYQSTISNPGFYRLADSVSSEQITIASSNVTLDMNGCTVSGGANGIIINAGLSNVIIKNGTVSAVTGDGIQINSGCSDIILDGITVKSAQRGIFCSNSINGIFHNCDLLLSNTGIELNTSHNIVLENCIAQANIYAGFSLVSSTTCLLLDCKALSTGQGNTNLVGSLYGFVNNGGQANIFERCVANATQGLTLTGSTSIVAGFALLGTGTQCHTINNSEAGNSMTSSSGDAEPYGIYLGQTMAGLTIAYAGPSGQSIASTDVVWSPDGAYIAEAGTGNQPPPGKLNVYSFNRTNTFVVQVASTSFSSENGLTVAWSPSGDILAFGTDRNPNNLQIYAFDRLDNTLTLLQQFTLSTTPRTTGVAWSPNGHYLAVAAYNTSSPFTNQVLIYTYDPIRRALALSATYTYSTSSSAVMNGVAWSPSGQYLAVAAGAGTGLAGQILIFLFNQATSTIGSPIITQNVATTANAFGITCVNWSADGNYIAAVGGDNTNAVNSTYIYQFNKTSLTQKAALDSIISSQNSVNSDIEWSPDMNYLLTAIGGFSDANRIRLYSFTKGTGALTLLSSLFFTGLSDSGTVVACQWSPDGGYIVASVEDMTNGTYPSIYLLNGIQFPEGNIITNNKVYGNSGGQFTSGTGIYGSSITNFIVGNSAFNNTFNYLFACNVFSPLFGQGPSLLQNSSLKPFVPIVTPIDIPQTIDRTRFLLESLVSDLL